MFQLYEEGAIDVEWEFVSERRESHFIDELSRRFKWHHVVNIIVIVHVILYALSWVAVELLVAAIS